MKPKTLSISLSLLLSFLIASCTGGAFINKDYHYTSNKEPVLAIFPPTGNSKETVDDAFRESFSEKSKIKNIIFSEEIRNKISGFLTLPSTIKQRTKNKETRDLRTVLDTQFEGLGKSLEPANLLLVPTVFSLSTSFGHTYGNFEFHLYDLENGSLIYRNSFDYSVNKQGEAAIFLLSYLAAIRIVEEINDHFPYKYSQ